MAIAIYPGTFDPITFGHIDVAKRASKAFEKLIIVVMNNDVKRNFLFNFMERVELINEIFVNIPNIEVDSYKGLMVDYLKKNNLNIVVRGLRAVSDFEFEMQMAAANKILLPKLDTFFLMTDTKYSFISSSLVKEIAALGGEIDHWVPENVKIQLENKFGIKK